MRANYARWKSTRSARALYQYYSNLYAITHRSSYLYAITKNYWLVSKRSIGTVTWLVLFPKKLIY